MDATTESTLPAPKPKKKRKPYKRARPPGPRSKAELAKKSNMGRRTILSPVVQDLILTAIRAGNYMETSARFAGITPQTFWLWMKKGEEGDPTYNDFYEAVQKARAQDEVQNVLTIKNAGKENWCAAAWLLERKHPDRFGRRETVHIEGEVAGAPEKRPPMLQIVVAAGAVEELEKNSVIYDGDTGLPIEG